MPFTPAIVSSTCSETQSWLADLSTNKQLQFGIPSVPHTIQFSGIISQTYSPLLSLPSSQFHKHFIPILHSPSLYRIGPSDRWSGPIMSFIIHFVSFNINLINDSKSFMPMSQWIISSEWLDLLHIHFRNIIYDICKLIDPLTFAASVKLLQLMRMSTYILACPIATAQTRLPARVVIWV